MAHVSVTIDGKIYRMACDEGQDDYLRMLAERMDQSIKSLREGFGEIGDQRLAIMAGIMMADQLNQRENEVRALDAQISELKANQTALLDRHEKNEQEMGEALNELTTRLNTITDKLASGQAREKFAAE